MFLCPELIPLIDGPTSEARGMYFVFFTNSNTGGGGKVVGVITNKENEKWSPKR